MQRRFFKKVPKIIRTRVDTVLGDTQGGSPWENFGYFLSIESNPPEAGHAIE